MSPRRSESILQPSMPMCLPMPSVTLTRDLSKVSLASVCDSFATPRTYGHSSLDSSAKRWKA